MKVYHVYIYEDRTKTVVYSSLNMNRIDLAGWLATLYNDYQTELKVAIL